MAGGKEGGSLLELSLLPGFAVRPPAPVPGPVSPPLSGVQHEQRSPYPSGYTVQHERLGRGGAIFSFQGCPV